MGQRLDRRLRVQARRGPSPARRSASWGRPSSTAGPGGRRSSSPSLALLIRTAYDYFRLYAHVPWVQAWWAVTYFNAWFMIVNDDPFVWFYYNLGLHHDAPSVFLWFCNKLGRASRARPGRGVRGLKRALGP